MVALRPVYARPDYVATLGESLDVAAWQTPVVARPFQDVRDAMGSYPMAVITGDLAAGVEQLRASGLVSVALVPDPLRSDMADYRTCFDRVTPFKTHLLIDGSFDPSPHHRERIRRGHRRCRIETGRLANWLDDWKTLYAGLVEHRSVGGMADFKPAYFDVLAGYDDVTAFAAFVGDDVAGMTLWFAEVGVVYNHLTACNELGYKNGAAFALYDAAISHFAGSGVMNLGGGPGAFGAEDSGLFAFKQGFSNARTTAHVCGAILDPATYDRLSARKETTFFPAYRG